MAVTVVDLSRGHEFTSKLLRVLAEDGLKDDVLSVLVNNRSARHEAVEFLNVLASSSSIAPAFQRARDILGESFISPQEIAEVHDVNYTRAQLAELASTLPDKEVLQWARDNHFVVVAGPPREMSLLRVRAVDRKLFRSESGAWFTQNYEEFAHCDLVGTGWLVISKGFVPDSTGKTWEEQKDLLADNERIPNVAEVAWFLTTYAKVRSTRLFLRTWLRTSSVNVVGESVHIGYFAHAHGLSIFAQSNYNRSKSLGIISARNLEIAP